jgi:sugar lactone lactonase YvrE
LQVIYKSVGPCCGYVSYYDCTDEVALGLDEILTTKIYEVYNQQMATTTEQTDPTTAPTITPASSTASPTSPGSDSNRVSENCNATEYSEWSSCSKTCGDGGVQFRYRANAIDTVEVQLCPTEVASTLPSCDELCVPEFGPEFSISVVASDLSSPRDLAFHPTPGIHLGEYSEGRTFQPDVGEELWVANGNNHSISIIASLGTSSQTTFSRVDRGYYHYMNNITALAFNTVKDSGRNPNQDTFNYFAVCNDNRNDYVGSKEPNMFMGPTLYDTDTVHKPGKKNTVNRIGEDCSDPADQCFFLHADMLHEAPACIGIAHDPEVKTAYGAVFWAFDTTGDNSGDGGQLVRFDFSQPHGPGSMDHSIAVVRRYPEVKLYRDEANLHTHAGMVVHPEKRILFISNPAKGNIVAVHIDTGRYSRTAREEYPIFSNRLPSFEYSIYECVEQEEEFAKGFDTPTGLALSNNGEILFVAERSGRISALEVDSGEMLQTIDVGALGYKSIGGLAISPETGVIYFTDMEANQVVRVDAQRSTDGQCNCDSRASSTFQAQVEDAKTVLSASSCAKNSFSLVRDYSCEVDATIPSGTLFDQVHTDTGYASDNPDVQSMAGMDEEAVLLANRTDCDYDSELNFDALLLGGYYCHTCLPRNHGSSCDAGGTCSNVHWRGFTCSNEFFVDIGYNDNNEPSLVLSSLHFNQTFAENTHVSLSRGVTYRFTVRTGAGRPVSIGSVADFSSDLVSESIKSVSVDGVTNGPIMLIVEESTPDCLYLSSPRTQPITLVVDGAASCQGIESTGNPLPESSAKKFSSFSWSSMLIILAYVIV